MEENLRSLQFYSSLFSQNLLLEICMDQELNQNFHTKRSNRSFNKKIIRKINQSVNSIAERAFQSHQEDSAYFHSSKNLLCAARYTPKVEVFSLRQKNLDLSSKSSIKRCFAQKSIRKIKFQNNPLEYQNVFESCEGSDFCKVNDQNQMFETKQTKQTNFNLAGLKQLSTIQKIFYQQKKPRPANERNWSFQQFLIHLYIEKTKDLRTKPNLKQQKLFLERYHSKFQLQNQQQIENKDLVREQLKCKIAHINAAESDFGFNSLKCICEFTLSIKICKIPTSDINSFSNVKTIVLDKNPLGDNAVILLGKILRCFNLLVKLSLVSVNISPKGAKPLLKGLIGHENLRDVNFSSEEGLNRNRFGESIKYMQNIVSHPSFAWQRVCLSNSNISPNGLNAISNGIAKQTTIKQLLLSDNDISHDEIDYFLTQFKHSHLKWLDLSNNQIGDQGFKMITQIIGCDYGFTPLSRNLKFLNLSNNHIKSYSVEFFCKYMLSNQALAELHLAGNNLSEGGLFYNFKHYISKNWTLRKVDLSNCFLSSQDLKLLFEGMQANRALEDLIVSKNNFTIQSFIAVAKMLNINKSLKILGIESCNITDIFIQKSQKDLKEVRSIQQINFNSNYISDKSGKIILEMVAKSKSIIKISFFKNCLSVKYLNEIEPLLKSNKKKKQNSRMDQKQVEYLKYISEIQMDQEESIKSAIIKLKQKQESVKISSLVCNIVKAELEEEDYKKQLNEETGKIKELEEKLESKLNKKYDHPNHEQKIYNQKHKNNDTNHEFITSHNNPTSLNFLMMSYNDSRQIVNKDKKCSHRYIPL